MKLSPFFESIKIQSPNKSPRKIQLKPLAKIAADLLSIDKCAKDKHKIGIPIEPCHENNLSKQTTCFMR